MEQEGLIKIGNVEIERDKALLAPMAGVSDLAFRKICKDHKAGLTCSEMVSAKALTLKSGKTAALLERHPSETPFAVQIFGSDPDVMAEGGALAAGLSGADLLDINMGCPTPKIVSNGDGSALLRDLRLSSRIIESVQKRVSVPVTVKIRLGWDRRSINAVEFAKMAEASGASAVCVHGRTREQMYAGKADRAQIARVKEAVSVPVIANGDVFSAVDARTMLKETGADLVMVGRGSLGNPWIFESIHAILRSAPEPGEVSFPERLCTAAAQCTLAAVHKGERSALLEARKHLMWYLKGIRGAKRFFGDISRLETLEQLALLTERLKEWGGGMTE